MVGKCIYCDNNIPDKRVELGYSTCMVCGEKEAKQVVHTVLPMHKSNYMLVTNRNDLVGFNTKGGLVK